MALDVVETLLFSDCELKKLRTPHFDIPKGLVKKNSTPEL
jgi:hypothetical protein